MACRRPRHRRPRAGEDHEKLDAFTAFGEIAPLVDIGVEHDGERVFIFKAGAGQIFKFSVPVMIYRELWRADGKYERGDAVTSDGSLWVAVEDDPAHEPGKGAKWRLAAMKGRNGRDFSTKRKTI